MRILVGRAGGGGVWARRVRERGRTEAVVQAKLHVYRTCDGHAAFCTFNAAGGAGVCGPSLS